jgi:hypothetical protein
MEWSVDQLPGPCLFTFTKSICPEPTDDTSQGADINLMTNQDQRYFIAA